MTGHPSGLAEHIATSADPDAARAFWACDDCGGEAAVFSVGDAGERCECGILIRRPIPTRRWCIACAVVRGFPWLRSERDRRPCGAQAELFHV